MGLCQAVSMIPTPTPTPNHPHSRPQTPPRSVDATWRRVMGRLSKSSGEVLAVTNDDELLKNLREANGLLEQVRCWVVWEVLCVCGRFVTI